MARDVKQFSITRLDNTQENNKYKYDIVIQKCAIKMGDLYFPFIPDLNSNGELIADDTTPCPNQQRALNMAKNQETILYPCLPKIVKNNNSIRIVDFLKYEEHSLAADGYYKEVTEGHPTTVPMGSVQQRNDIRLAYGKATLLIIRVEDFYRTQRQYLVDLIKNVNTVFNISIPTKDLYDTNTQYFVYYYDKNSGSWIRETTP